MFFLEEDRVWMQYSDCGPFGMKSIRTIKIVSRESPKEHIVVNCQKSVLNQQGVMQVC